MLAGYQSDHIRWTSDKTAAVPKRLANSVLTSCHEHNYIVVLYHGTAAAALRQKQLLQLLAALRFWHFGTANRNRLVSAIDEPSECRQMQCWYKKKKKNNHWIRFFNCDILQINKFYYTIRLINLSW